jgi:HEAT repeat protein
LKFLLDCETVVKACYQSHKGSELSLEIVEILRGKAGKPGEVLKVKLSGAGVVKLSPRWGGSEAERRKGPVPSILFVHEQGMTTQTIPATYDAAEPHVYFFPKANNLRLDGPSQIQTNRRGAWKLALEGKPLPLSFRLLYDINSSASREAIEELFRTREKEAIADLVDAILVPRGSPRWIETQQFAERALATLGDRNGDVYEPVLKALSGPAGLHYDFSFHLVRILALGDKKRALADFKALLSGPRPRVSPASVIWGMNALDTKEGLDYLLELLEAGGPQALESLKAMMYNEQALAVRMVNRARIQEMAAPRLQKIIKSGVLSKEQQGFAMFREYFRSLVEKVPDNELHWFGVMPHGMNHPAKKTFPDWNRLVYEANGDPEKLLNADLVVGRQLIRNLISKPDLTWKVTPAILEHLSFQYGDPEMVRQFKKPPERVVRYRDTHTANVHRTTHSEFMKLFKETPKLGDAYWARLAGLFPDFPEDYFREILSLLESNSEHHRHFAIVHQLQNHFFWDFDLDPKDLAPVIRQRVAEIKPLLERMSKGDLLTMRAELLRHFGIKLEGPPGKGWLPAVQAAALHWNPTVKLNAVRVLSMLEEDSELTSFANYPWMQRREALEAHLKQTREKLKKLASLTGAGLEGAWKNLGSDDRAVAYAAMQALADSPGSVVPWLRKNLKEPGQDHAPDPKRCAKLIGDLSSAMFKVRSQASEELKNLGEGVVPHLRQALEKAPDLETRRRIEELLDGFGHENSRYYRLVRAIQVLEYSAGREARALLEELARGPTEFSVTHEARQALGRLKRYWRW